MPVPSIDKYVGKLTTEETKECLLACLENLQHEESIVLIRDWLEAEGLNPELLTH